MVKLITANPIIPYLQGATFDIDGNDTYTDSEHHLQIEILEKIGTSYRIRISPV